MTTLPLLAHKMDRNPFGRCVLASVAHTGLAPYWGKQKRRKANVHICPYVGEQVWDLFYSTFGGWRFGFWDA